MLNLLFIGCPSPPPQPHPPQCATCVGNGGYVCGLQLIIWQPGQIYGLVPYRWVKRQDCLCAAGNLNTGYWPPPLKAYSV